MKRCDGIINEIFKVLIDKYGVPPDRVNKLTRINRDLGIEGDDAAELIGYIEDKLDISIAIEMPRYFLGEGLFAAAKTEDLSVELLASLISEI